MTEPKVTVYGAYWCPDCRRSKKFLGEQFIPYRWVDIEQDKDGENYVLQRNDGKRIIPMLVFEDDSFLKGYAELDQYGFVLTGHDIAHGKEIMGIEPLPFETSISGIFAAGDVRHGSTKQVASAVGEGAAASISIREFLRRSE
jgi:thioredoxin reductase